MTDHDTQEVCLVVGLLNPSFYKLCSVVIIAVAIHIIYCNVGSWLVWGPPLNNHCTLFKVESQIFSSQEKNPHLSKDFNWLQLKCFLAEEVVVFVVLVVLVVLVILVVPLVVVVFKVIVVVLVCVVLVAVTGCFFSKRNGLPNFFCHNSETLKTIHGFRIIWEKFATITNLATNQHPTLLWDVQAFQFPQPLTYDLWLMTVPKVKKWRGPQKAGNDCWSWCVMWGPKRIWQYSKKLNPSSSSSSPPYNSY